MQALRHTRRDSECARSPLDRIGLRHDDPCRRETTAPAAGLGASGLPVRHLDGLLRRLPGRPGRSRPERRTAFQNGEWVLRKESEIGALFEPAVQRVVDTSSILVWLTSYTYWLSQFAVVGITLLWVYFRHHERFAGFRNWLIAANLVGLLGYVFMPTAPPRMFPEWGFVDTLAQYSSVNHSSGLIASPRTRTRRCRACTRWTRSSSGSSCSASCAPASRRLSGSPGRSGSPSR